MTFSAVTLNHFRAVNRWLASNGAEAQLDPQTFILEITARNRYFQLKPRFLARSGGQLAHTETLSDHCTGFIGWLPYRNVTWPLAQDKLLFKEFIGMKGLPTPRVARTSPPNFDFIIKRSIGSFGFGQQGPFKRGTSADVESGGSNSPGEQYVEEFIEGTNVKAWFWGTTPFCAEFEPYATVVGDGVTSLEMLVQRKLAAARITLNDPAEAASMRSCLQFQQVLLDQVPASGKIIWLDYRYGRQYPVAQLHPGETGQLSGAQPNDLAQLRDAGRICGDEIRRQLQLPLLFTLDGVKDRDGRIHWLEMNSNPIFATSGYTVMLNDLFGIPPDVTSVQAKGHDPALAPPAGQAQPA